MTNREIIKTVGQRPYLSINEQARQFNKIGAQAFAPLAMALAEHPKANWKEAQEHYINTFIEAMPKPNDITSTNVDMGGVPGLIVAPNTHEADNTIFYIHGGGYVSGSASMYVLLASRFALRHNAKVYIPDYRIAPDFPYPIPIDDTFQAYKWLVNSGCNTANLSIIGDSAGGAMVVTIMVKARNGGIALPVAAVALSPWADLENNSVSMYNRNHLDGSVTREILNQMAHIFLDGILPTDPDVSPVYADVRGLSPTQIFIGENEVMLSDAIRLAAHLGENRVRVSLDIWPGLFHAWPQYGPDLKESEQAIEQAIHFIEQFIE